MRRLLIMIPLLAILVTACRSDTPAPEPPTVTIPKEMTIPPTTTVPSESASPTPLPPTATPPASATPAATGTAIAGQTPATATPLAVPTTTVPPPSTVPPTPTAAPPPGLAINFFVSDLAVADPGDRITLSWATQGATTVTLWWLLPTGQLGESWDVPPAGSFTYDIPVHLRNGVNFLLYAGNPVATAQASLTVVLRCTAAWFFANPPGVCPYDPPLPSPAAEQRFEHGTMLWVGAEDLIYVLFDDQQYPRVGVYSDEWDSGEPETDPGLVPPAGLFQPVRGFGLVWREQARARLGWAIEPEVGFETLVQRTSYWKYNETYIRARDGRVWHLLAERSGWELLPQ